MIFLLIFHCLMSQKDLKSSPIDLLQLLKWVESSHPSLIHLLDKLLMIWHLDTWFQNLQNNSVKNTSNYMKLLSGSQTCDHPAKELSRTLNFGNSNFIQPLICQKQNSLPRKSGKSTCLCFVYLIGQLSSSSEKL